MRFEEIKEDNNKREGSHKELHHVMYCPIIRCFNCSLGITRNYPRSASKSSSVQFVALKNTLEEVKIKKM